MAAVEVGGIGLTMGDCFQVTAPDPVCSHIVGWSVRLVECHCDNMSVVTMVNSSHCRDPTLMHMLRCLFFVAAHYDVTIRASHFPGVENTAADALSRNDLLRFPQAVPEPNPDPSLISLMLVELLVTTQPV